jgi:hypothetical protein
MTNWVCEKERKKIRKERISNKTRIENVSTG